MHTFKKILKLTLPLCLAAFLAMPIYLTASVKAIQYLEGNQSSFPPAVNTDETIDDPFGNPNPFEETTEEEETQPVDTEPDIETEPPEENTEPTDTPEPPPVILDPEMQLSFYSASLEVGQGIQLTAAVVNSDEPNPMIAYYSSDTSVARIDNSGYIIATGVGRTSVTAYWGNVMATAAVTVTEAPINPEYIVVNRTEFQLKIGAAAQIEAKLLPEEISEAYTMTYTSNNTDVVSVNQSGLITALSTGEANITVESAGIIETVHVVVSNDIAYEHAKLDGYLYNTIGEPIAGSRLVIDDLSAVTDNRGYFSFEEAEQRELTIKISSDDKAECRIGLTENTTVYLLYENGSLTRRSSYDELAGLLPINSASFDTNFRNIVLTVGQVESLTYQYEPKDAVITEILYSSSNAIVAQIGQIDGVITAKSPGETIITLSLNGGQAEATCTITVNPAESTKYSIWILIIEFITFAAAALILFFAYKKYKKKAEAELLDDEADDDIHDID